MANELVVRALKGNAKKINLSSRNIDKLPKAFSRLTCVLVLQLNNNCLASLPLELQCLRLTELNLGNNDFEDIPVVLKHLNSLKKLYLFGNKISSLPPDVLEGLPYLSILNLNHNKITDLPSEIQRLRNLEMISLTDNQLEAIPAEIGLLKKLTEINLTNNKLTEIPRQLYNLTQWWKLHLARNNLTDLPEGVRGLENLKRLDVAGNQLSMFPADFQFLCLEDLFFEGNTLVQLELLHSTQKMEVLSLKEHAARFVLKEVLNKLSVVFRALPLYPDLQSTLSHWHRCALCLQPFLTTWLECVQFINLRKDMGMRRSQNIPVRVLLCSYCFNKAGHSFYGVAKI